MKKKANNRWNIKRIERSNWYNGYSYVLPHVLKYQVLSLFRNLKEKQFNKKFHTYNGKEEQARKDSL